MIKNVRVSQGDDASLLLACENEMQKDYFDQESHQSELSEIIADKIQKQVKIKAVFLSDETPERQEMFIDPRKINLEGVDVIYEDD